MSKKVGVLLAGCGVYDGSEIHEAVLTLLYLDQAGAQIICMAPNMDQLHVIDHLSGTETSETRNVLVESARIARGEIKDLKDVQAKDLDALIIPGGFGAAKNLSNFAINGAEAQVQPDVQRIITDMVNSQKPVGALCIAPATLAKAIADKKPEVTIGNDQGTADAIEKIGGKHVACAVDQTHIDKGKKIVTTPAYMLGPGIKDVAKGIEKLVKEVLSLI
ncbi:isoprenoid biosynthesis glyoxalase ElbB [uncultured Desulfobacter sp.]|uniref:isoprenoid biosynthesis glyoxalase ElbB n=1 Tax=uncultured Desulfobacter sp. TaxID=240139 RepID=UPI002AAB8293|nr:isoprenoid biosynthesis glyoxalase ElbB [uncultured Desulfobacter sp.]